jgi:hypothetical protein
MPRKRIWPYALKNEETRRSIGEAAIESRRLLEGKILGLFRPEELPMSTPEFALLLSGLIPGLIYSRRFGGISDALVLEMFEGFAAETAPAPFD